MTDLTPKQRAALELLDQGEEYQGYFFQKVRGLRWFRPLKDRGFFDASRNPPPRESSEHGAYTIPHWMVLDYLESVAAECGKRGDLRLAEELLQILRDVTQPRAGQVTDNYRTWWYFAKIMRQLPTSAVSNSDVDMIDVWLEGRFGTTLLAAELGRGLLPRVLESADSADWIKALRILDITTRLRRRPRPGRLAEDEETFTRIEPYWLRELFARNYERIGERCVNDATSLLASRLREAVSGSADEYSYIWRAAVEDHVQNHERESVRDVLVSALRDVGLAVVRSHPEAAKSAIAALLANEARTVRRVGIYLIDAAYDSVKSIFWERIDRSLFKLPYRHELFLLLRHHFQHFAAEEKTRVVDLIAGLTGDWAEGSDAEMLNASLRLEWLEAIRGQGNVAADALYQDMKAIAGFAPEHPEFPSYSEASVGWGESPLSAEDLLARPIPELVAALRDFRERREWKAPTAGGLAEALKRAIVNQPQKFESALEAFRSLQPAYLYAIFEAFEDLWKAKKRIAWDKVLEFAWTLLHDPEFRTREAGVGDTFWLATTPGAVVSAIVGLIEEGVRDDSWALDDALLPKAEQVIGLALEHAESSATGESGDALTEAYNTVRGHGLRALINYALRRARIMEAPTEEQRAQLWEELRPRFDAEVEKCRDTNIEFSALAGAHLPNFYYLSQTWVEQNIDRIFSTEYEKNWRAATEGFSFVSNFYRNLYVLLRDHGHVARALGVSFKNDRVREQLIRNVAVGYLLDLDPQDGQDLFTRVSREFRQDDVSEIIWFFWEHHKQPVEGKILDKILAFWGGCISRIEGQEPGNASTLSDLNLLTALLQSIDDTRMKWLSISAPYVDVNHHSSLFLEYLERLASSSPRAVALIVIRMLTKTTPTYDPAHIRSIVEKLYDGGAAHEADQICNEYARRGATDLLRAIYEGHHR